MREEILVWYWIEKDEIIISGYLTAMFCSLQPVDWARFEILGFL